ncbi:hypothetical protein K9L05_01365, partial [Candidatus Babeliales bacterium]|nr:hypothetical protein [Candidatus Babeliales bacterium]
MGELKIYPKVSKLLAYSLGAIFLIGSYSGTYLIMNKEKFQGIYNSIHILKDLKKYESFSAEEKEQFEKRVKKQEEELKKIEKEKFYVGSDKKIDHVPLSPIKKFLQLFVLFFFSFIPVLLIYISLKNLKAIFWNFYRLFKYIFNKKPELKIDSVGISNVFENKQFIWEEINKIEVKEGFNWLFFLMPLLYRKKYYYLNIYLKDQNKPFFIYLQNIDQ